MPAEKKPKEKTGRSWLSWFNPFASGSSWAGRGVRAVLLLALLYALAAPFVGFYAYNRVFPEPFDPRPAKGSAEEQTPAGVVFTSTLVRMGDQLLVSWLPNDVIWPSVLLDNPQNFQLGELEVIRYSTRVLRDKLSRLRTTDRIDPDCDKAFTAFSNNPELWLFPAAEAKYRSGVKALQAYEAGLRDGKAHFYPRADNLIELLDQLASLLGGVNTRLANAPRDRKVVLSTETAGDSFTEGEKMTKVAVPWSEIDDNFYYARGVAYGTRQVLLAAHWEFREVLQVKKSTELLDAIIDDLALADFEPLFVLNGSRDSIWANHSLSLMASLESTRQKITNLQQMLER